MTDGPPPRRYDALLLASFGGPEGPDEVLPFLERVTAGRGIPAERLVEVGQHYYALGGVSPINAQNRALLAALRSEVARRGLDLPVYFGNRNSAPFFADTLAEIQADGHRAVLALATSAFSSYSGCRQYREDLALAAAKTEVGLTVHKLRPYADRPGFTDAFAQGLAAGLADVRSRGAIDDETHVFFTTHSVPHSMARTSGPDPAEEPDQGLYVRQHLRAARRIVDATEDAGTPVPSWSFAYQSRSGPPQMPWLEPDINDALRDAAGQGVRAVVLVPLGFVSDHMEVVWDLDHQAHETAEALGLVFHRAATPGCDQAFVSSLVDLVSEALGDATLEHDEPWERMCGEDCCVNARAQLPTVPGV